MEFGELEALADAYSRATTSAWMAREDLYAGIRRAVEAGMSESEVARVSRISRPTVRKILGK